MINNAVKIVELFKSSWKKALLIFVVFLALVVLIAYFNGFFGEKGKQHATMPSKSRDASPSAEPKPSAKTEEIKQSRDTEKSTAPQIYQHTEGDQSPAIVSKDSTINYGSPKGKKKD